MSELMRLSEDEFPVLLGEISDPPQSLWVQGSLPPPHYKFLTVVGSRRVSRYGKDACEHLVQGLAGYPISIVSGLALGVDGIAHKSALKAGLHTVAVPGSGLSEKVLYPRTHIHLAREIVAGGGALLSEFEPEEPPAQYKFGKRNRIMAGMSHAVLIIEATQKSGTLITAKLTVDYNRDLLVVPHSIFAEGGEGGHLFMKLGASPVRTSGDILDALQLTEETIAPPEMSDIEAFVYEKLSSPLPRDELIRELDMPTSEANALLLRMEINGLIKEVMGEIRKTR